MKPGHSAHSVSQLTKHLLTGCAAIAFAVAALAIVWPLPHTIALRNSLMAVILLALIPGTQWSSAGRFAAGPAREPAVLYLAFTAWILIIAVLVSPFQEWTLNEISGQWFGGATALLIGAAIAFQRKSNLAPLVVRAVLAALVVQVAAVDAQGLLYVAHNHGLLHMARLGGLSAGPGKASYLSNFLLSGLVAESSLRMEGRRYLELSTHMLGLLILLAVISIYFEAMRNELFNVLIFVAAIVGTALKAPPSYMSRRTLFIIIAGIGLVAGTIIALDLSSDPRWQTLMATIPIALDTTHHLSWLNPDRYPLPHLPGGQVVSASNYLRIAWIKEALKTISIYPLGVGYGRTAFGQALHLRFGNLADTSSLNNSFLTIAIGTGIPGALLWLGWFFSLGRFSARHAHRDGGFISRFLLLIVLAFGFRMGIDSDMQNYTLEQFLFFVGLLMPLALRGPRNTGPE